MREGCHVKLLPFFEHERGDMLTEVTGLGRGWLRRPVGETGGRFPELRPGLRHSGPCFTRPCGKSLLTRRMLLRLSAAATIASRS